MFDSRRVRAALSVAALVTATVALTAGGASAGSQTSTNACRNSATGTYTDIDITLSGTAGGDESSITLGSGQFEAFFPAAVLVAGYNLGLLVQGVNDIPGTLSATIDATNTSEGSQTVADVALTGTTTITDPDGTPGNGDETATDLSVVVAVPDTTWTPTGGDIEFRSAGSEIEASLLGGIIKVNFTCTVGTSTPAGCVDDPATDCTGVDPATAAPFETVDPTTATTTTTGAPTTTTTAAPTTTTTAAPTTTTTAAPTTTTTAPPSASSGSYTTECTNSVTPDVSTLEWTVTATAPASATTGETVTVTDQTWGVTVPGSVFDAGVNLSLITAGQVVTADVTVNLIAGNTTEGSQSASDLPISMTVEIVDGSALDATATFAVPDMSFTAGGGDIGLSMGDVVMAVDIGLPLAITFSCSPVAGQPDFATIAVAGAGTTTTTAAPTTSTTAAPTTTTTLPLAHTGPGETALMVVIGFMLLNLGYLVFTAGRPPRRKEMI